MQIHFEGAPLKNSYMAFQLSDRTLSWNRAIPVVKHLPQFTEANHSINGLIPTDMAYGLDLSPPPSHGKKRYLEEETDDDASETPQKRCKARTLWENQDVDDGQASTSEASRKRKREKKNQSTNDKEDVLEKPKKRLKKDKSQSKK
ncbi:hypothetical protein DXG01_004442 [Tephrocybe rancida]|nr:hypothetical protein DXG01_004442 [Tephrocybe rancida]